MSSQPIPAPPQDATTTQRGLMTAADKVKLNGIPEGGGGGSLTLAAVGSSPNDNGATAVGTTLTLQPASATKPGVLTTGTQVIGGAKQFSGSSVIIDSYLQLPIIKGSGPGFGLLVESQLAAGAAGHDHYLYTTNVRTAGKILTVANASSQLFSVDYLGNVGIVGGGVFGGDLTVLRQISATGPDSYFALIGNRSGSNAGADLILGSTAFRTAGAIAAFQNQASAVATVGNDGTIRAGIVGGGLNCPASFIDATGSSGHVSLTVNDGLYAVILGKLAHALTDGLYAYAGLHGDVTVGATYARSAGLLLEVGNPQSGTGAVTDKKFYVDFNGGFGQLHGKTLAQFGSAVVTTQATSLGQFYYGQLESTLMWATDAKRWYFSDGAAWKKVPAAGDATAYDATDGSGTAGSQTINKLKGKGKFAAGASSLTITNSFVTTGSHVSVVLQTNDATAILKNVPVAAGTFTVNIVACTADTVFSFVVEN